MSPLALRPAVGVFAKEPVPGRVKTRLAEEIGAELAAELARSFVEDLVERLGASFEVTLFSAEDPPGPVLASVARAHGAGLAAQVEGSLGDRMAMAMLALGPGAALVGSDVPTLPAAILFGLKACLEADGARAASIALAPAADGGFVAIAAARPAELREVLSGECAVRWSSPHALADVVRAARGRRLGVALGPPWWDVDSMADLAALGAQLRLAPHLARRTASILGRREASALRAF